MDGAVFKDPLTLFPPALAHLDGSLYRTDKVKLFHKFKELTDNEPLPEIDIFIVNVMFFLHTLQNPPIHRESWLKNFCKGCAAWPSKFTF